MLGEKRVDIVRKLQTEVLRLQCLKPAGHTTIDMGWGEISRALPDGGFPLGAIHEFLSAGAHDITASCGFIAGLLSPLMGKSGTCLWISSARTLFPPALKSFGIQPDRVIFICLQKENDVLWAMNEALKCSALSAVVGEMQEISFKASRKLQLAVESSRVTGFVLRHNPRKVNPTACVSRWKITTLPSDPISTDEGDELPGVGFPQWRVELMRIRNGKPGIWDIKWRNGRFFPSIGSSEFRADVNSPENASFYLKKKTG